MTIVLDLRPQTRYTFAHFESYGQIRAIKVK